MKKLPLSFVVITFNEEKNIERCLRSASFAKELIVVDSFSTDATVEIAQKMGAKVISREWAGFGSQKNFAAEQASFDWILSLDADEEVSPQLIEEISAQFTHLDPQTGYLIPRKSWYLGRWILNGGWYPDYQLRLFNKKFSRWPLAKIHERVIAPKESKFESSIHHFVFDSISDQVVTNDRYSSLQAKDMVAKNKAFSIVQLIMRPVFKFLETYVLKRGFLDGLPGFIISVSAAYSMFLRYAKLWEINRK